MSLTEAGKRWLGSGWLDPLHIAKRSLRRGIARVAPRLSGRLLDIGCGVKPYRALFPAVTRYVGIERPGTLSKSGVVDAWADALALPFADGSFDSVLCSEVLEHVPEPGQLFAEAARVLKPGGMMILSTPQTWGVHEPPHDYYRFTRFGLEHLARRSGFEVLELTPTCGAAAALGQRLSAFLFYGTGVYRVLPLNLLARPFLAVGQLVWVGIDRIHPWHEDPLDHVLLARRGAGRYGARGDYGWAARPAGPQARPEYDTLVRWTPQHSAVIDLGCGDGSLGARLIAERGCVVQGIEIDPAGVERARARGLDARIGDVDQGLDVPDGACDVAIMNVTLHMVYRPGFVLGEMLRVAPVALVSFPNFAYWPARLEALAGRFPRRPLYGFAWHETRHIHLFSWSDFNDLVHTLGARVTAAEHLGRGSLRPSLVARRWPNLLASLCIARVERGAR